MSRVTVIGSLNMDVVARVACHPRPGETVGGRDLRHFPGGKGANQAIAAARIGAPTKMVGMVGNDPIADQLVGLLNSQGIDISSVRRTDLAPTGTALIVVSDSGENTIVVVPGANAVLTGEYVDAVGIAAGDVVVCQGEVPIETVTRGFEFARQVGALTVFNPAPVQEGAREILELADVLVVNESELSVLLGRREIPSAQEAVLDLARLLRCSGDQTVVVTLGAKGAVAIAGEREVIVLGRSAQAVDTTGAGDCFVGTLAARLADQAGLDEALDYANVAASICVQRLGAGSSMPTKDEVDELSRSIRRSQDRRRGCEFDRLVWRA